VVGDGEWDRERDLDRDRDLEWDRERGWSLWCMGSFSGGVFNPLHESDLNVESLIGG